MRLRVVVIGSFKISPRWCWARMFNGGLTGGPSIVTFVISPDPIGHPEKIADLVGHSGTTVTELVYRHQIRPVIQTGALVMDGRFKPTGT
jgi:hypothetical protein